MISLLLLSYALLHGLLLAWSFSWQSDKSWRQWYLRAMLLGMMYDNTTLALAPYLLSQPWYEAANYPRYVLHASLLPVLTLFGLSIMRSAASTLAGKPYFIIACLVFTLAALLYGLWHEVHLLQLAEASTLGFTRLASTSDIPPMATILSNIAIIPMAAVVWKLSGWRVFFFGAVFIFLVNGASAGLDWGFLIGNGVELVFVCCLLLTERRFAKCQTIG